jgi:hypothetical protein
MAIEKSWSAVAPQLFTADGTALGIVTVASTAGFKVKQTVVVVNPPVFPATVPTQKQVQVKRVISSTQLIVGPLLSSLQPAYKQEGASLLSRREDISAFTVALGAYIYAEEQPKAVLKPDDIIQAVYDQEPAVAIRTTGVDQFGNYYTSTNPFPVNVITGGGGGTIPTTWYDIAMSYDSSNNLTQVIYYSAPSVIERTLTLSYDSNNNLINVLAS